MDLRFFKCEKCGNIVALVKASGAPISCCGEPMKELIPGSVDAAAEKHVPVYEVKDGHVCVTVGEVDHPMLEEHFIEWVSLQTKAGNQRRPLAPGEAPKVCFPIDADDEVEAVYAYCNLHGLWKA